MPESTETRTTASPSRTAALSGLAVVGFVALVALGLFLAVSASRFVPGVANGLGSAAVYLGSVFAPGSGSSPTLSTSTPSVVATSTITIGTPAPAVTTVPSRTTHRTTRTPGTETTGTFPLGGTATTTVVLSGLPDLTVHIDAIGYLATTSAESFVATSTVHSNSRPAVRFTITNIGTNVTGAWRFSASIPTSTGYIFQSQPQQSLAPGDSIQYTLGFDQANTGSQTISVTANFDHAVSESNTDNNSASATLTILGG